MSKKIFIHTEEQVLVDLAINLGDWILSFPEVLKHRKAVSLIQMLQEYLRMLPEIKGNVDLGYGYRIERGNAEDGLIRTWNVYLSNYEGFGLSSVYTPIPEPSGIHDKEAFLDMVDHEEWMDWSVEHNDGSRKPYIDMEWVKEIREPLQYFQDGDEFSVYVETSNQYFEITCEINNR